MPPKTPSKPESQTVRHRRLLELEAFSQDVIEDLIEKAPKETKSFVAEALSSAESMPDIKESMEKSAERISKEE